MFRFQYGLSSEIHFLYSTLFTERERCYVRSENGREGKDFQTEFKSTVQNIFHNQGSRAAAK